MNQRTRTSRAGGFTLIELVVVMGILSGFLVMLVQLVDTGLSLFTEGETGQMLADRGSRAERVIRGELQALRGSQSGRDRDRVEDRLLVQLLPIGLPPTPERSATRVQVIRAAVHLPPERELQLIDGMLALRVITAEPDLSPTELAVRVAERRAVEPLRGIGNMLLLPWRQANADDAMVELRVAWFLPGQTIVVRDRQVDPFEVPVPGTPELPAVSVLQVTEPLLQDLLHCEFAFWSQHTTSWQSGDGTQSGGPGAELVWDSARGGWLVDDFSGGTFALDRGGSSLSDPTDDIQPHAIRVVCVVAQAAEMPPEGLLASPIGADDPSLELLNGDRFPGAEDGGHIKIGGEWIRYAERRGDRLTGLVRGARRTKAIEHKAGVRVHVGQTVEFVVPVPHRKDDWNG